MHFRGRFCRGKGEAAGFTELPWVKDECRKKFGFVPYPGTVNLKVEPEVLAGLRRLAACAGVRLVSPDPRFCHALGLKACLRYGAATVEAAVILPLVEGYYEDVVELVAPVKVMDALQLQEGAELEVDTEPDSR